MRWHVHCVSFGQMEVKGSENILVTVHVMQSRWKLSIVRSNMQLSLDRKWNCPTSTHFPLLFLQYLGLNIGCFNFNTFQWVRKYKTLKILNHIQSATFHLLTVPTPITTENSRTRSYLASPLLGFLYFSRNSACFCRRISVCFLKPLTLARSLESL